MSSKSRELKEEPGEGKPPSVLLPVRWAVGHQTQQVMNSKGCDAGVVGRKPLLKCSQKRTESGTVKPGIYFLPCDMSSLGFSKEEMINSSSCVMTFFSFLLS